VELTFVQTPPRQGAELLEEFRSGELLPLHALHAGGGLRFLEGE
jgi:hypothetical protein